MQQHQGPTDFLTTNSFVLKRRRPHPQTSIRGTCQALQPCNVVTLLLGGTFSGPSGTSYGSHGVSEGLRYCAKHDEKYKNPKRSLFAAIHNLLERQTHTEALSVTRSFKLIFATLELTIVAIGGGHKVITVAQCVVQLCTYGLILRLYICLHFSRLQMGPCTVCVCIHKF